MVTNSVEQLNVEGRSVLRRPATNPAEQIGTLVLLHGYGADEYDLMGLAPFFEENLQLLSIRAPGSTPYGGASWFDIGMLEDGSLSFDGDQALDSCLGVIRLLESMRSSHLIPDEQIFLGGFSQGASVSNLITLTHPEWVKALLIMSGRLTNGVEALLKDPGALNDLPVFCGHGVLDQVIPVDFGRKIVSLWGSLPVKLEHHEYAMGHEISQAELTHIQMWFQREVL